MRFNQDTTAQAGAANTVLTVAPVAPGSPDSRGTDEREGERRSLLHPVTAPRHRQTATVRGARIGAGVSTGLASLAVVIFACLSVSDAPANLQLFILLMNYFRQSLTISAAIAATFFLTLAVTAFAVGFCSAVGAAIGACCDRVSNKSSSGPYDATITRDVVGDAADQAPAAARLTLFDVATTTTTTQETAAAPATCTA
ncbi:MAG: hypothetical protein COV52_08155 [Gammaproteobacteria bacterium CG11_big_fil_rev_8_21_14_0_20_46_22]|nr:MAG: hypothetical protein COW05_08910 [Gammaproteobacteria bacterium CG12_big_fil_rev_8_21_14_0_65_46_12]PIR10618.1 MAG: hypothetical protein COV52_08155 [Gammaproteobacteria bacterium CG11_big_fil_rev_8_21_14_0_20_46_22]